MAFQLFANKKRENANNKENFALVKDLVNKLLIDSGGSFDITLDTKFEDIGFDSIKFINLLLSLEDIINIDLEKIAEEIDPASIKSVADVVALVNKLKK